VSALQLLVERGEDSAGWVTLGAPQPGSGRDQWRLVDTAPPVGEPIHYRLREPATGWTGGDVVLDPLPVVELRLVGVVPNPVGASSKVTFSAASGSAVELMVTDVLGRVVAERHVVNLQPGVQSIAWGELARLPMGLY